MKRGRLIVFEGISGTGKETQAKLLQSYLTTRGIKSHIVYHPSPELKAILSEWRKTRHIDHVSEAYFLLADRYNRVIDVIKPAIVRGEWVISLRNWVSALVYQAKSKSDREYLTKEFGWFEPVPDVLFFFDISPDAAIKRIMMRHNEAGEPLGKFETRALLSQKRSAYKNVIKSMKHERIDASQKIEAMHKIIRGHIPYLAKR